jgi:peptidoglycan/xylan/chitin deacetylase (PgdA/CDA1 family)
VKPTLKNLFYAILSMSGFYRLWKIFNRKSIVFLTLHGVMNRGEGAEWTPARTQISTEQLDESVRLISKYYHFVSLEEAVQMLSGELPFRGHSVVITFDDGYRNNLTHALPVLRRHGVPAILFAAVGHVEKRKCFWFDRLDYALQQYMASGKRYCLLGDERIELDNSDPQKLQQSVKSVIFKIKELSGNDGEAMAIAEATISELERATGKTLNAIIDSDPWCGVASWDDVKLARERGMVIGSHTVDHARVGLLDADSVKWQLSESKKMIEEKLNQPCDYFCYPNGSYNQEVIPLVREVGYKAALTTQEGVNYPGDDLYQLKRLHMPQGRSPQEALAVASGFSFKLSLLLRMLRETGTAKHK